MLSSPAEMYQPLAVSFYVLFASLSTIPIIAIMYVFRWAENSSRLLLIVICLALLCFHLLLMLLVGVFLFALLILLPRNLLRHFGCDISLTVIQLNEEAQAKVHAFFPLLQMQVICYGRFFVFIRCELERRQSRWMGNCNCNCCSFVVFIYFFLTASLPPMAFN